DALAAKKDAEEEAAAAREVATFMGGLFEEADPFILSGRTFGEQPNTNPTAMEIVERGAERLANPDFLKDKPLVRATLLDKVGHVFMIWGHVAKAEPFILEALELRENHQAAEGEGWRVKGEGKDSSSPSTLHPQFFTQLADLATSRHNAGFL